MISSDIETLEFLSFKGNSLKEMALYIICTFWYIYSEFHFALEP